MQSFWLSILLLGAAFNATGAGSHEHGVAHLSLVAEGRHVQLLLSLPADDVPVGEQSSESLLLEPPLSFSAEAGCQLISADVEREPEDDGFHQEHEHLEHAHRDSVHKDIEITYLWRCAQPVFSADVILFQRFAALQLVKAKTVSSQAQSQQLTRDSSVLMWR